MLAEVFRPGAHQKGLEVDIPMQSGILTESFNLSRVAAFAQDDWRRRSAEFQHPGLSRNLAAPADSKTARRGNLSRLSADPLRRRSWTRR